MILPTKGVPAQLALISIGGDVLRLLEEPKTVSRVWEELRQAPEHAGAVTFDWFVLALDLLFLMGAIDTDRGRLQRASPREGLPEVPA